MEDYREIGPPGNGNTRKTRALSLAAVRKTARHVELHANRVIFRGALISDDNFREFQRTLLLVFAPAE